MITASVLTHIILNLLLAIAITGDPSSRIPKLNKELGVVVTPYPGIPLVASRWNHVIQVKIPCLSDTLTTADIAHLDDSMSIMADLYRNLDTLLTTANDPVKKHTSELIYRMIRARSVQLYKDLRTVQQKSQYGWGIFQSEVCKNIVPQHSAWFQKDEPQSESETQIPQDESSESTRIKRDSTYHFNEQSNARISINNNYVPGASGNSHDDREFYLSPSQAKSNTNGKSLQDQSTSVRSRSGRLHYKALPSDVTKDKDDKFDEEDDLLIGSSLSDEPSYGLSSWQKQCIIPYRSSDDTNVMAKVCVSEVDEFNDLKNQCTRYKLNLDRRNPHRPRRSLCNFCGKAYSFLFGLSINEDMIAVLEAVKNDFSSTVKKVSDVVSEQKLIAENINTTLLSIGKGLDNLASQSALLKEFATELESKVNSIIHEVSIQDIFNNFLGSATIVDNYLLLISKAIEKIHNWYRSLKFSLQAQTIDLDLIPHFSLQDTLKAIEEIIPDNLDIPEEWMTMRYLRINMVSVAVQDHDVILSLRIPLTVKSAKIEYWKLTAIPHRLFEVKTDVEELATQSIIVLDIPKCIQ